MSNLDIATEMANLDLKVRDFYDKLSDEERKKFSTYLMIRWGSSVAGVTELQEYYLLATNQRLNKHFFDLKDHPKLQWLLATTISPGIGKQYHKWISPKKKDGAGGNKTKKFLMDQFPHLRDDEIEMMLELNTEKDIKEYAVDLGMTKEQIKKEL